MKVGVNLINFGPSATPRNLERWVAVVESLGFHALLTSDHIVTTADVQERYPAPFYEPLTTLGYLAAASDRLLIGTTVMIVPYRHPLEVARALANVDQLSGGRCIFGVGVGWATQEFAALGVPFNRRGAMTNEYLAAMKAAWANETASFKGEFVAFDDVFTAPLPVQRPHPPIWVGGASDAAVLRAIRQGDAWHPIRIKMRHFAEREVPRIRRMAAAEGRPVPALCPRLRFEVTPEPVAEENRCAGHGTLEQIHRDLTELAALGCEHVLLDSYHDDLVATAKPEAAWSMLTRLAEEVVDLGAETLR